MYLNKLRSVVDCVSQTVVETEMQKYAINLVRNKHCLHILHLIMRKNYHISKVVELIFKGELTCLQGCFRMQTGREDV